jgi:hypothetical protein
LFEFGNFLRGQTQLHLIHDQGRDFGQHFRLTSRKIAGLYPITHNVPGLKPSWVRSGATA